MAGCADTLRTEKSHTPGLHGADELQFRLAAVDLPQLGSTSHSGLHPQQASLALFSSAAGYNSAPQRTETILLPQTTLQASRLCACTAGAGQRCCYCC